MMRLRLLVLLAASIVSTSAAWADDLGYVDCAAHPDGFQLYAKPRQSQDVVGSVPCGERFAILVNGFIFSRVQTNDGKIGFVLSSLISVDHNASSMAQANAGRSASPAAKAASAPAPQPAAVQPPPVAAQPQPAPVQQPVQTRLTPSASTTAPAPSAEIQPAASTASQPPAVTPAQPEPAAAQTTSASAQASSTAPAASPASAAPAPAMNDQPAAPSSALPTPPPPSDPQPAATQPQTTPSMLTPPPSASVPAQPASPAASQPEPPAQRDPAPVRSASARSSWEKPLPGARRVTLLEFFGGFSYTRFASGGGYFNNMMGGLGSFGINLTSWLQVTGDSSYNFVTISGTKNVLYGNHFGPRFYYRKRNRWSITPFGEALVGGSRFDTTISGTGGYTTSTNCLSYKVGGGVDMRAGRHWEVRVVDFDYYRTAFGTNLHQNSYSASVGVVLRLFGGSTE